MWFRGLSNLNVDAKGRVAMPKVHRDTLDESGIVDLIVTASPSKCLNVYAKDKYEELEQQLMALANAGSEAVQTAQRLIIGYATPVRLDGTGRMLLAPELRGWAAIDRKAVFVGQGSKFEIWGEARWEREFGICEDKKIDMSDAPPELLKLSF